MRLTPLILFPVTLCLTAVADFEKPNANEVAPSKISQEATLVHGSQRTKINLATEASKVRDGDMVLLEEGRYLFPGFAAKGVKLVGKGWNKTWLTDYIAAAKTTLATKETQFWNMTIPYAEIENSGMSWFVNVRFFNEPKALLSVTVPGMNPSTALLTYMSFGDRSIPSPLVGFNHWGTFTLSKYEDKAIADLVLDRDLALPEMKKFGVEAAESIRGDEGKVDPDLAKKFFALRPTFETEIRAAGGKSTVPTRMLQVLSEYFLFETGVGPPVDTAKVEALLAKAKAAKSEGALLVAQLFANEAKTVAGGASAEADILASEVSTSLGEEFGCRFEYRFASEGITWTRLKDNPLFSPADYETRFRRLLNDSMSSYVATHYPLLAMGGENSPCKVTLYAKRDSWKFSENVTKVEVRSAWVESEASQQRRAMYAEAAARASQKASAARWNAATESMAGTAKKMYEGRVRTENYGGQSYLVYGKGNFAGAPSTMTSYNYAQAKAEGAEAREQMSANPDLVEVKTTLKTFFSNYEYTTAMDVEVATKGEKSQVLLGPTATEKWAIGPCTRKNEARIWADCPGGSGKGTTGEFVNLAYLRTHVEPFVDQYLATSVLPRIFKKIADASKSASDVRKLDAMLLASRVGVVFDEAKLTQLAQKVFGRPVKLDELAQLSK